MSLPSSLQDDDPIIKQFKPVRGQWELNDDNIKRIDPQTGQTILHNYCQHIDSTPFEVYQYLIEIKGCDVNVQDDDENTPLILALRYFKGRDITVLMYLLSQKGVNANIKCQFGYTLLHDACERINKLPLEIFKVLIETLGCDVNAQDKDKDTPLHDALRRFDQNDGGNINVLICLLGQMGVDPNIKNLYGYTLLHTACRNINYLPLDIFKVLIETLGCDVNVQNKYDDTPIHRAIDNFNPDEGGDIKALAYLIDQKDVNANAKGRNDRNLLHLTCINNLSDSWNSAKLNAKVDSNLCQIVEAIAERCVQQVLDETNLK
jgi:ankyrin repeat protein